MVRKDVIDAANRVFEITTWVSFAANRGGVLSDDEVDELIRNADVLSHYVLLLNEAYGRNPLPPESKSMNKKCDN